MKTLVALCFVASLAFGQTPNQIHQLFYSGSLLQYDCAASAQVYVTTVQVSDSSLTSIAVTTNIGTVTTANPHGLWPGAQVTISGSTTGALNATYVVKTVTSSTAYTITTAGVGDATYATAALVISTNAPLLTQGVWSISVFHYTASVLDGTYLAGPGASISYKAICANRANY